MECIVSYMKPVARGLGRKDKKIIIYSLGKKSIYMHKSYNPFYLTGHYSFCLPWA